MFVNRKKRSREEIIASVLLSAKDGTSKTSIMYANYLSFSQLNKYIAHTIQSKLMEIDGNGRYFTTKKGLEYLRRFYEMHNMENGAIEKRRLLVELLGSGDSPVC